MTGIAVALFRARALGLATCVGLASLTTLVAAGPASAMPTVPCTPPGQGVDRAGKASNQTINVNVPAGTRVVVCTGAGTDVVNINSIGAPANLATELWIAFGNGAKTINWNAGNFLFNNPAATGFTYNQAIIVRPPKSPTNPPVVMTGINNNVFPSEFVCGTNVQFKGAANGGALYSTSLSYLYAESATGGAWVNQNALFPC